MSLASGRCILVPPDPCGRITTNWDEVPRSSHIQIWLHKPRLRRGNARPYMKLRFTNYQTSVSPFNIEIYIENKGAPQDSVLPTALLSYLTFLTWDFGQTEKLPLSTKYPSQFLRLSIISIERWGWLSLRADFKNTELDKQQYFPSSLACLSSAKQRATGGQLEPVQI